VLLNSLYQQWTCTTTK